MQITATEIMTLAEEYYASRKEYLAMVGKGVFRKQHCKRLIEARAKYETEMTFQPTGNRVLVCRIKEPDTDLISRSAHDERAGSEMLIVRGVVLAVGPGNYDDDGDFCPTTVEPGQKIMFNARWNDFANSELVGSNCDGSGPLVRPMPQWQWDKRDLYLITEGDIAGILATV